MKNTKILTVLGVLLAMGITACGGNKTPANPSSSQGGKTSTSQGGGNTSTSQGGGSQSSSGGNSLFEDVADPDGHHFGAEEDVQADAEAGAIAYKKATCGDNDNFFKFRVNQSQVTFDGSSSNKSGTPEGYVKLANNNESLSFKIKADKMYAGKLFFLGRMDGYSTAGNQTVGLYRNGSPNIKVEINGKAMDLSSKAEYKYSDTFGTDYVETTLASPSDKLSHEGYVEVGAIVLEQGVNTFKYTRLASQNMIVRDFVFVVQEHTHSWPETWESKKPATYTELGSEERVCSCGAKQQRDVNTIPFDIDTNSEVIKLNSDNTKVSQFDYNSGAAKVAAIPMKEISAAYPTTAVENESEKWTLGEALELTADKDSSNKAYDGSKDGKLTVGDTYKLGKGVAIAFKVNVSAAINNAFLSIGAKYSNPRARHFYNDGDWTQQDTNGDKAEDDGYRYYTRVNSGEFQPIGFNSYMSEVFGDGSAVKYMPLGKFNLQEGENTIYLRQSNLGYRVTLQGYLFIELGNATVSGNSPAHTHQAGTEWKSDENEHWHECVAPGCDEEGIKLDKGAHDFGPLEVVEPATCDQDGVGKYVCQTCQYEKPAVIKAAHDWDEPTEVAADGENVAYNKFACKKCDAVKLEVALSDSMLDGTSANKNDPIGFMKLKSNDQSFSFKFNYAVSAGNNMAIGKIYQRGVMDNWTSNPDCHNYKLFSSGSKTSSGADDCKLTLNGKDLDLSAYKEIAYGDVMIGDAIDGSRKKSDGTIEEITGYLSPITDVECGNGIVLNDGVNTFKYTRKGSYNMGLSHIVFVVKDANHTHEPATAWSSDENTHWHECADANCPVPGYRDSEAPHEWDDGVISTPATAEAAGVKTYTCSVCGRTKTESIPQLPLLEVLGDDLGITGTSTSVTGKFADGVNTFKAFKCTGGVVAFTLNYNAAEAMTVKLKLLLTTKASNVGSCYFWKQDNTVKSQVTLNDNILPTPEQNPSLQSLGVDGNVKSPDAKDGTSSMASPVWCEIISLDLVAGPNTIKVEYLAGGYSYWIAGAALYK